MYKNPITIIQNYINARLEDEILKIAQNIGIDIDKKELLKAFRYGHGQYAKGYTDSNLKWIPTKYKYPKKDMKVLVTKDVFSVPMVAIAAFTHNLHAVDPYDFAGKEFNRPGFFDYDSEWGYYEVTDVTAWMPIPEPWEDK